MTTITNPNAQTLLEFANLQVAAEAFLVPLDSEPNTHTESGFDLSLSKRRVR